MTRVQIYAFSILHAVAALLLPLLIVLLGGCLEVEKLQVPPQVSCESVETALNEANTFNPALLTVNDFVHTEETMAPLANNPQILADVVEKLINRIDLGNGYYELRFLQTIVTYKDGEAKQETKEAINSAPNPYQLCPSSERVTYHGLQVFNRKSKVTTYRSNCGSYANCEIAVTEVKFDQLIRQEDGRQEVRKFNFIFSKEVPYIARSLKSCMSGTVDVNGQPVPITQCSVVKNFGNQP